MFLECPRDTAFPYQNKPTHSLQRNPSLNSILSLKCPYYNPSLHPTFFSSSSSSLSLSLSLSLRIVSLRTHIWKQLVHAKLAFHCYGQLIADDHQIANKNKKQQQQQHHCHHHPSSIILDPKSAGLWATI